MVGKLKAFDMIWCIGEALAAMKRKCLAKADTMLMMRDERHGRMHVRFVACGPDQPYISGFLGQSRDHTPDSLGIVAATEQVYKNICTKYFGLPNGKPEFDAELYNHLCKITEAVAIDSASNEVVAAKDMCTPFGDKPALFPNCSHILRDAPPSARRVLSRLWKADTVMANLFGLLCHDRDAIAQICLLYTSPSPRD